MPTPPNLSSPVLGLEDSPRCSVHLPAGQPRDAACQRLHQQRLTSLGILASSTAHELKNLLTPIILATELATSEVPAEHSIQRALATVLTAARRARDLAQRFAEYGAARAVDRQPVAVSQIVAEVLALLRPAIPPGVSIHQSIAPGLPPVAANALHVHQVLTNLLMNAWQAMPASLGRIELRLDAVTVDDDDLSEPMSPPAGRFVRLTVTDDGVGVDAATRARIFDAFFTTNAHRRGTGLGLAIVREIIREYRGGLTVESSPGHGATFRVYWPVTACERTPA